MSDLTPAALAEGRRLLDEARAVGWADAGAELRSWLDRHGVGLIEAAEAAVMARAADQRPEVQGVPFRVMVAVEVEALGTDRFEAELVAQKALGFPMSRLEVGRRGPVRVVGTLNGFRAVGWVRSATALWSRRLDDGEPPLGG